MNQPTVVNQVANGVNTEMLGFMQNIRAIIREEVQQQARPREGQNEAGNYQNRMGGHVAGARGARRGYYLGSDVAEASSSDDDNSSVLSHDCPSRARFTSCMPNANGRLPAFCGKETWQVWRNRFEEVARHWHWNNEERLDELLPKLQGEAGEFVFSQLPPAIRGNYKALMKELDSRFKVIENVKTCEGVLYQPNPGLRKVPWARLAW